MELVPGGERVGSAEVVPLVRTLPALRQARGGGVCGVLDLDGRGRGAGRVVVEVGADQVAVPRPVVLGVGGRVDAGVAAAGLDVALERRLLGRGEHVTGGGEEDDDLVLLEVGVVEDRAVLGHGHREVVGEWRAVGSRWSPRRCWRGGTRQSRRRSARRTPRLRRPAPMPRRPCQQSRARTRAGCVSGVFSVLSPAVWLDLSVGGAGRLRGVRRSTHAENCRQGQRHEHGHGRAEEGA